MRDTQERAVCVDRVLARDPAEVLEQRHGRTMPFPLCPHSRRRHRRSHVAASKLLAHTLLGLLGQNSRYIRIGAQTSSTCTSQSRSPVSCPCFTPPLLEGIQPHLMRGEAGSLRGDPANEGNAGYRSFERIQSARSRGSIFFKQEPYFRLERFA